MRENGRINCAIIGTCQAEALYKMFSSVDSLTDLIDFSKLIIVHLATREEIDNFYHTIDNYDLIIHQPISDVYRNGVISTKRLMNAIRNKPINSIMFPYIHWEGYFPSGGYLKDSGGKNIQKDGVLYHDKFIIKYIIESIPIECLLNERYIGNSLTNDQVEELIRGYGGMKRMNGYIIDRAFQSIRMLEIREQQPFNYDKPVDVKITDYIQEFFSKKRLFHTMNHPCNNVLFKIAERILFLIKSNMIQKLNVFITMKTIKSIHTKELLGDFIFPIYDEVRDSLQLEFNNYNCILNKKTISKERLIRIFFNHYLFGITRNTLINNYLKFR